MSETKHTPGPWKVENGGLVGGPVGFGHVCQMWNKFEEDFRNAEANARLIAAAPDLLSALKNVEWSGTYGIWAACPYCLQTERQGHLHNCPLMLAIAKAEGTASAAPANSTEQQQEGPAKP